MNIMKQISIIPASQDTFFDLKLIHHSKSVVDNSGIYDKVKAVVATDKLMTVNEDYSMKV